MFIQFAPSIYYDILLFLFLFEYIISLFPFAAFLHFLSAFFIHYITVVDKTISITKQRQYVRGYGLNDINNTKTDSGNRTISIPSTLTDLLKEYQLWQNEQKIVWGDKWVESNKLFTKENGEPIFPETPSKWFKTFIKRNNLPYLTFHQLRHTHATLLIGQGTDIATVSNRLGHADKSITLKVYTHVLKENDKEAVEKLGKRLTKKKN